MTIRCFFVLAAFYFLNNNICAAQAINPLITKDNIWSTICVPGYSKSVRPPSAYTNRIKKEQMNAAGIDWSEKDKYELDHVVSIEVGGAPRDRLNLKIQPWDGPDGARAKDIVETRMRRLICSGKLELDIARECLGTDWKTCP